MRRYTKIKFLLVLVIATVLITCFMISDTTNQNHSMSVRHGGVPQEMVGQTAVNRKNVEHLNIWRNKTVLLHPDVNIVPSTLPDSFVLPKQDCVPLPLSPREGVVICIHSIIEDRFISKMLKEGQLWEHVNLFQMRKYLQADPTLVFVDIGSNIGEYTLFAAALGRRVLAVEMLPLNVQHIQKALGLSGLGPDVVIVNNALYSDHMTLTAKFILRNIGGARLDVHDSQVGIDDAHETVRVQTICMDDLVPLLDGASVFMKMDIENSEHHALRCGHSFFEKVNVKVVQMEWLNREQEEGEEILAFMSDHGYVMSTTSVKYVPVEMDTVSSDVYFLKQKYISLDLV